MDIKFHYNLFVKILFVFILSCSSGSENGGSVIDPVDPPSEIIPKDLSINITIEGSDTNNPNGDGSGLVKFSASATNAVSYSYRFGTGDSKTSTGSVEYTYSDVGTKSYNIKVLAYSSTNNYITIEKSITVYVKPVSDPILLDLLAGSTSKTWRINAAQDAHFSNGSEDKNYPNYWEAFSFSKSDSGFYDDEFTFNVNGTYIHKTNNTVFGKGVNLNSDFGTTSQTTNNDGDIENYPLDNYETTFSAKSEDGIDKIEFNDSGFIGFYVGSHNYTIECYDDNNILIRTLDNNDIAWYLWLSSQTISETPSKDQFTNLIWEDTFDYNGEIDSEKWTHEVREQWYNNEVQSTTNLLENSKVENGILKLTAIKKSNGDYTSARIMTHNKLDYKYGRIDVRAKMPAKTNGVWPAIWLLGSNYNTVDWPACGEMDIQEYAQTNQFNVQSTVHKPDGYAGQGDSNVTDAYTDIDSEFHIYSLVWTKEALTFYVNDEPHHIVGNSCSLPFNHKFYLILNFAMGGDMGGEIDSSFTRDSMEIDYVKVYQ
jgi:hypothetical protein